MREKEENHVHTFERLKIKSGRKDMYRCLHPDCKYYTNVAMIVGKWARCKLCMGTYIFTGDSARLKVPHCGCRSLTPEQRERLSNFGKTTEDQQTVALDILESMLRKGMD